MKLEKIIKKQNPVEDYSKVCHGKYSYINNDNLRLCSINFNDCKYYKQNPYFPSLSLCKYKNGSR